ncbi:hypothetical protein [Pseudoclavibacter helvolus]|uniref:hypothetical protein n=1 Tax=Pseudoclavibacter helvolus TaxID=255205 RepID=UPI003C70B262
MTRPTRLARTVLVASLVLVVVSAVFPPMFPIVAMSAVFATLAYLNNRERV